MPICAHFYSYDEQTQQCNRCERGLKSYGLQDNECITCMRAWLRGQNDGFRKAQYQQFCNDGFIFSIVLFSVVPFVTIFGSLLLCCCAKGSDIHQNHLICEDAATQYGDKKRPRKNTGYVKKSTTKDD